MRNSNPDDRGRQLLRIVVKFFAHTWNKALQASTSPRFTLSNPSMLENSPTGHRGSILILAAPTVIGLWFVSSYALSYLSIEPSQYGIYWPRHEWLLVHIVSGIVTLLLGPTQFWLGLNGRRGTLHRILGSTYVLGVAVSASCAFYLAAHTDFGWVFGVGLSSMAATWIISTALATTAILRRQIEQHREWMIRSYVVTFAFVTFRALEALFDAAQFGTLVERMTVASWLAWAAPLMITEVIIQGRKIFAPRMNVAVAPSRQIDPVVLEPMEFELQNSGSSYLSQR
jgi:uncharacterized membrane protein